MQARSFPSGLVLYGFWVSRPRGIGDAHAPDCAHVASLHHPSARGNWQAVRLAKTDGTRLDHIAASTVFLGIRTIRERGWGMVPLYAARVQDLGTGDYVVIKCGACGHTAEIPPSGLLRGL